MIQKMLNKRETDELFDNECILIGNNDVVPFCRLVNLFGDTVVRFIDNNMKMDGYFIGGRDYNAMSVCSEEMVIMYYVYREGFYKVVG